MQAQYNKICHFEGKLLTYTHNLFRQIRRRVSKKIYTSYYLKEWNTVFVIVKQIKSCLNRVTLKIHEIKVWKILLCFQVQVDADYSCFLQKESVS